MAANAARLFLLCLGSVAALRVGTALAPSTRRDLVAVGFAIGLAAIPEVHPALAEQILLLTDEVSSTE